MCGFCNVWVSVCVGFVMRGCVYVWVSVRGLSRKYPAILNISRTGRVTLM